MQLSRKLPGRTLLVLGLAVSLSIPASAKNSPRRLGVRTGSESKDPLARLRAALEILVRLPSGKSLIQKAENFWGVSRYPELISVLRWGVTSRTDAVLTRHYNPRTGEETRERQVSIYLKKDQPMEELVLDIAHEFVHATSRPGWDPYDPALTPGKYILSAIEGQGGEVDAVAVECGVWRELSSVTRVNQRRCEAYLSASGSIEKEKVRQDFYRVGKWNSDLSRQLGSEHGMFPLLSSDSPRLFSSTGKAPYPVALLREFEELTQIACENSQRRVAALSERNPASDSSPSRSAPMTAGLPPSFVRETQRFLSERCGNRNSRDF